MRGRKRGSKNAISRIDRVVIELEPLPIMSALELKEALDNLHISQADLSKALRVAARTVRRWLAGERIPGPVDRCIRAWLTLHRMGERWQPFTPAP